MPVEFSPVAHSGYTQKFGGSYQDTNLHSKSYAAYFDASWEFIKNVSLIGGARQTWDDKKIDYNSLFEDNLTPYPGFPVRSLQEIPALHATRRAELASYA